MAVGLRVSRVRAAPPAIAPVLAAAPGFLAAAAVATWWLVGDLSAAVPPGTVLDHFAGPWPVPPALETAAGVLALVLGLGALVLLALRVRAGRLAPGWFLPLAAVLVLGVLLGYTARVATAGVIGANIGAGLLLLLGGPLAVVLLVTAAWRARVLLRG